MLEPDRFDQCHMKTPKKVKNGALASSTGCHNLNAVASKRLLSVRRGEPILSLTFFTGSTVFHLSGFFTYQERGCFETEMKNARTGWRSKIRVTLPREFLSLGCLFYSSWVRYKEQETRLADAHIFNIDIETLMVFTGRTTADLMYYSVQRTQLLR